MNTWGYQHDDSAIMGAGFRSHAPANARTIDIVAHNLRLPMGASVDGSTLDLIASAIGDPSLAEAAVAEINDEVERCKNGAEPTGRYAHIVAKVRGHVEEANGGFQRQAMGAIVGGGMSTSAGAHASANNAMAKVFGQLPEEAQKETADAGNSMWSAGTTHDPHKPVNEKTHWEEGSKLALGPLKDKGGRGQG